MSCSHTFIRSARITVTWEEFSAFYRYIRGHWTRKAGSEALEYSERTIFSRFTYFLDHPLPVDDVWKILPPETISTNRSWVYGCDGKWLRRVGVFFIHRNVTTKENLYWSFMANETYDAINRDLATVSELLEDHHPVGAVSDWKGAIVTGIAAHFGNIPHQRCLAHVERQAHRLLPLNSPFKATRVLRNIASDLFLIEAIQDPVVWKTSLLRWQKRYGEMLTEKTRSFGDTKQKWWYTHTNIRRAWRLLTHDPNPLFVFLTNSLVPKTNNALEGVNSNLKQKLGDHRGMSVQRQAAFLSWYMTFTRTKTEKDMKKLWVYWKSKFSR